MALGPAAAAIGDAGERVNELLQGIGDQHEQPDEGHGHRNGVFLSGVSVKAVGLQRAGLFLAV
jgi:hypothetical protein